MLTNFTNQAFRLFAKLRGKVAEILVKTLPLVFFCDYTNQQTKACLFVDLKGRTTQNPAKFSLLDRENLGRVGVSSDVVELPGIAPGSK